jgi:Transposase IS66 family
MHDRTPRPTIGALRISERNGASRRDGSPPDRRSRLPIVVALKTWFEKQLSMISSGSTLVADIRYALAHGPGLTRYLEDGRLEMDTNPVENAIRPVALTRASRRRPWPVPSRPTRASVGRTEMS